MRGQIRERVAKIINSFDILRKILDDKAICYDDRIIIFDPPFEIQIMRREEMIIFSREGDDVAVLSESSCWIKEGFEDIVENWVIALTSLGFKRFILRQKKE